MIMLNQGDSGDTVRTLQSFLAQDAAIYPEGLITGYFGLRTQDAVRRLQAKNKLPQTGSLDMPTRELIFPCAAIQITSPDGGEVWNTGETHNITWDIQAPIYIQQTEDGRLHAMTATPGGTIPRGAIYPYFADLSIDLTDSDTVVYHIGSVSLYNNTTFAWTIPSSIPHSSNYKVRISMWKNIPYPYDCKTNICPMVSQAYPIKWNGYMWDESDASFTINDGAPTPSPMPLPLPNTSSLIHIRQQVSDAMTQLQNTLALLDKLIAQLAQTR